MKLNFGQLRGKTIRVLDVGAGTGNHIISKARKNPNGVYVALDPVYAGHQVNPALRGSMLPMQRAGVIIRGATVQKYFQVMIKNKIRVRTINADLPNWKNAGSNYIHALLVLAPKVLLPGGRIFMTIEKPAFEKEAIQRELEFARQNGFKMVFSGTGPKLANKSHDAKMFIEGYGTAIEQIIFTLKK